MPRVQLVDIETAQGETARFFEATTRMRGRVPNAARAWANIPYIVKFNLPFGVALHREAAGGVLSNKLKEMAIIKTSHVNACSY